MTYKSVRFRRDAIWCRTKAAVNRMLVKIAAINKMLVNEAATDKNGDA